MVQNHEDVRLFLITLILSVTLCNCANILCIFPVASYSHQQPQLALSHALAARGHNLTVITANPSKVPIKNHREIDLNHLYQLFRSASMEKEGGFSTQKRSTGFELMNAMTTMIDFFLIHLYKSAQIQDLIKEINGTKYDLIIFEELMGTSLLGFADLIGNPPIIGVITANVASIVSSLVGNPTIPSYSPSLFFPFSDHMTFWERFQNLYFELYSAYMMDWLVRPVHEKHMHANFGNYNRKMQDLELNQSLLIVSADLSTSFPKPFQPNTIHVGPMHVKKELDPLPQDIQKWMDESEEGVIYFSLGSNMQGTSVPENTRTAFIKAFKQFPKVRVLWKWESDKKLPGQPDNVLVKKWLPQQPILAHPKTRLFISQVGLQSLQEAIYYGVPILGVPMFADQDFNVNKLVAAGNGLGVEFHSITYEIIYKKLNELLTNTSYKENMLRQSLIMKDRPMSPVDTAVWWVEYVLRHNGTLHLRPASLDLLWYQYYMLDILLVIVIFTCVILYLVYFILKKFISLLSSAPNLSSKSEIENKKKKN